MRRESKSKRLQKNRLPRIRAKMPDGLDTIVGDNGVMLWWAEAEDSDSRAFLKDAPVLILDELLRL